MRLSDHPAGAGFCGAGEIVRRESSARRLAQRAARWLETENHQALPPVAPAALANEYHKNLRRRTYSTCPGARISQEGLVLMLFRGDCKWLGGRRSTGGLLRFESSGEDLVDIIDEHDFEMFLYFRREVGEILFV